MGNKSCVWGTCPGNTNQLDLHMGALEFFLVFFTSWNTEMGRSAERHRSSLLRIKWCSNSPSTFTSSVRTTWVPRWWSISTENQPHFFMDKKKKLEYHTINGHFRDLNWRYLPDVRPIFKGFVREYRHKIWPNNAKHMVLTCLHFRILEFPLILWYYIHHNVYIYITIHTKT